MQNGQVTYTDNGVFLTVELYNQFLTREREQEAEILYLKQELAQLKRMIFGSKSERHIGSDPGQLNLGLDIETVEQPERETEQITYTVIRQIIKKDRP
jgi:transposase